MTETQRTAELCVLDSEAEAMAMEMELRENGIVPVVVRTASDAFPGVVDRARWGTLRVAEGELERAREVLEAWYARDDDVDEDELERQALEAGGLSEEARHRQVASLAPPYRGPGRPTRGYVKEPPPRPLPMSALVAGASIALNVGLVAWIVEKSDDEELPSGDAIEYELSGLGGEVIDFDPIEGAIGDDQTFPYHEYEHDSHGEKRAESFWEEGREHPSSTLLFDVHGTRTTELLDEDGDAREESISSFDREGRLTTRLFDTDEDGRDERLETYDRQGRVASELLDADEDGRWDETRVHAGAVRESALLRDEDGDGHFESVICDGAPRAIRCP